MRTNEFWQFAAFFIGSIVCVGCAIQQKNQRTEIDTEAAQIFFDDPALFSEDLRASLRPISADGLNLTTSSEAFRDRPYNDPANYCTIAYGHLLARRICGIPEFSLFPNPLPESTGREILGGDMRLAEITVARGVKIELTNGQYDALCDFVYNVGAKHFLDSTLLAVLNNKEFEQVPVQLNRWVVAGGKRLPGLVNRRSLEAKRFFSDFPLARTAPPSATPAADIDIVVGERRHAEKR